MKFMVMVNNKYMVSLEASSCLAAEHKILDEIRYGMQSALAFDQETTKTEHFIACMMQCQTISYEELHKLSEVYTDGWKKVSDQKNSIEIKEDHLRELEARCSDMRDQIRKARWALAELQGEAERNNMVLNVQPTH